MAVTNSFQIEQKLTIAVANSNRFKGLAANAAKIKFDNRKKDFLKEFDDHAVSREIKSEGATGNISETLNGKGNLFSFIGFHVGTDPIGSLRSFLDRETMLKNYQVQTVFTRNRIVWTFAAERPSLEDIYSQTPYPDNWKGGSWVFGVENGIPGLFMYIYWKATKNSRSQQAVQGGKVLRNDQFAPVPYIKALLGGFKENLKD